MTIKEKLYKLRRLMAASDIDAILIPSTDPHQSEYVADHWQERQWISGFTGSAGTVAITQDYAGLWTDSRYFLQAEAELAGTEFVLHKMSNQFAAPFSDYLVENLKFGSVVGINGWMFSKAAADNTEKILATKSIRLNKRTDLISQIWTDRPPLSNFPAYAHDTAFAGVSVSDKMNSIRAEMIKQEVDYHYLSALDDIAWTFNIRGQDVECNPLVICYAITGTEEAHIFINENKIPAHFRNDFENMKIRFHLYDELLSFINNIPESKVILVDKNQCSAAIYESFNCRIKESDSIPRRLKAIKNETEIEHIRNAMAKDGAAIANTFYWLEKTLGNSRITECTLAEKLAENRAKMQHYAGESFSAIVGYQSNGAIIHYHPVPESCSEIKPEGILLVDSGGQYLDGTTDITRTIALSTPSDQAKRHYTLILKGMIALSVAKFPEGTTGAQLDTLARQFLWSDGLNYLHGTGHGVGFFLNVHEPPQGFAPNLSERGKTVHEPGMLSSNEPGYYIEGNYGMRIENLILCIKSSHAGFLEFETMTLYPYDKNLIDINLITPSEREWINAYHKEVYDRISPFLNRDVLSWFEKLCSPL
jgi:Xaa-Pro aminopeptidase